MCALNKSWDDPLETDGPSRTATLRSALGVTSLELSCLIDDLHGGISCNAWGFPQLADLGDVEQRALVSDQLLSAADGNQTEAVGGLVSGYDDWFRLLDCNGRKYRSCHSYTRRHCCAQTARS